MISVIQLVNSASVQTLADADARPLGAIERGLCVMVGFADTDSYEQAEYLASKLLSLRLFPDDKGRLWRLSVADASASVLLVSNFTLTADLTSGTRPSFSGAAKSDVASELFNRTVEKLAAAGCHVLTGQFGAEMIVDLANWGPSTFIVQSKS